jgi:acetyl-CoA C-acetyltransferase
MNDAYIISAVRTPVGRRNGALSRTHPADLSAAVISEAVRRSRVDPEIIDDVYWGCVDQVGAQSFNIARTALLSAGLPERVPGTTIDRQCGSSQQAIHFAAQAVMSGSCDVVIAGGVEVMSLVPLSSSTSAGEQLGYGSPLEGQRWLERYAKQEINQFNGAELIAQKWNISRDDMQVFALESHRRAAAAQDEGRFIEEILSVDGCDSDEAIRRDSSMSKMGALSVLREGGRITAALASQIADGAAALTIASGSIIEAEGLTPLARIHALAVEGSDPVLMLTGPIAATIKVLRRGSLKLSDIDRFEVNEAFASVVIAWARETGASLDRTNVNGGAIALGHPLGATGARLMTSLVYDLKRTRSRYGLQTMCEGGGMANATIIEAL